MKRHPFTPTAVAAILAMWGAVGAAHAAQVDFSGYFRSGTGLAAKGGKAVCFWAPGADTKFRLGNECDTIIEPTFAVTVARPEDESIWKMIVMPSVVRVWGGGDVQQAPNSTLSNEPLFRQSYVTARLPSLNEGTVWIGRRFYDRMDNSFYINDFLPEQSDGQGGGIENVQLGLGRVSYAFFLSQDYDASKATTANKADFTHRVRWSDIPTIDRSKLSVYLGYSDRWKSNDNRASNATPVAVDELYPSYKLGLYHRTDGTLGGQTLIGVQGTKNQNGKDSKRARFMFEQRGYVAAAALDWDFVTTYQESSAQAPLPNWKEKWFSIGARLDKHISGPYRVLFEVGHDKVRAETDPINPDRSLTKATVALAISPTPSRWSRPTLRFYYTAARWSEGTRNIWGLLPDQFKAADQVYGHSLSGGTLGMQAEAWW